MKKGLSKAKTTKMLIFKSLYSRELLDLLESSEGGKLRVNQLSTRCAHILEKKIVKRQQSAWFLFSHVESLIGHSKPPHLIDSIQVNSAIKGSIQRIENSLHGYFMSISVNFHTMQCLAQKRPIYCGNAHSKKSL